jgi:hypothetical protein
LAALAAATAASLPTNALADKYWKDAVRGGSAFDSAANTAHFIAPFFESARTNLGRSQSNAHGK